MKKIIATVLAMVMALALCTTAMAATTSETITNGTTTSLASTDNYNLRTLNSNDKVSTITLTSYTTLSTKVVTTDGKETKTYIPAYYTGSGSGYYYECVAESATYRVFKGEAFVCYVTVANTTKYDFADHVYGTATAVAEGTGCGSYAQDVYVLDNCVGKNAQYNGKAYAAMVANNGTDYSVMDGKLVTTKNPEVTPVPHDFTTGATVTYKANSTTPIAVVCKTCKKSFDVVKAADLGSYSGSYLSGNHEKATAIGSETYVIKLDAGKTDTNTNTNTDKSSPKTFDAGIAMYVGMALTSVAGSAVMIGKKKEF